MLNKCLTKITALSPTFFDKINGGWKAEPALPSIPGSTGQGWEGKGKARLSLPLDQRTGPLHPAESQLEPIPQGVTLWMGPHLEPLHSHAGDVATLVDLDGRALNQRGLFLCPGIPRDLPC